MHLTKDMNDQMVEIEWVSPDILPKNETQPDMSVKGATSTQKFIINL